MITIELTNQYPELIKEIKENINRIDHIEFKFPVYYNFITKTVCRNNFSMENQYIKLTGFSDDDITESIMNTHNKVMQDELDDSVPYIFMDNENVKKRIFINLKKSEIANLSLYISSLVKENILSEDDLLNIYDSVFYKNYIYDIMSEQTQSKIEDQFKSLSFMEKIKIYYANISVHKYIGILLNLFVFLLNLTNDHFNYLTILNLIAIIYLAKTLLPEIKKERTSASIKILLGKSPLKQKRKRA